MLVRDAAIRKSLTTRAEELVDSERQKKVWEQLLRPGKANIMRLRSNRDSMLVHDRGELLLRLFAVRVEVEDVAHHVGQTFVGELLQKK